MAIKLTFEEPKNDPKKDKPCETHIVFKATLSIIPPKTERTHELREGRPFLVIEDKTGK